MTKFINKVSSSFDTPLEKILETVKKMVDNKLDGFTDSIDQKLIHLANSKNISPQVPSKSLDGKQILYKINDKVIDPDKLQASIDGKIKIKWCKFQNQCKILSCKFYHESELCPNFKNCCSPTCYFRHPCAKLEDKKKRMWNNSQSSNSNSRKYFSARVNGTSKSIGSQPDKEQTSDNFIPFNSSKQGTKSTAPFRSHSFHQPPPMCKFGTKCWNRDCNRKHPQESKKDQEILSGLGFLGKLLHNIKLFPPKTNPKSQHQGKNQRRSPGLVIGAGGRLKFY